MGGLGQYHNPKQLRCRVFLPRIIQRNIVQIYCYLNLARLELSDMFQAKETLGVVQLRSGLLTLYLQVNNHFQIAQHTNPSRFHY